MLGVLKRRWKTNRRPMNDFGSCNDEKDEPQDLTPPRYIKISDGKISLCPPKLPTPIENNKDQEIMEARIVELEEALSRLQEKFNNSQCNSPTLEKDLKEQLENMNKAMRSKERKAIQACRDHKVLQARFSRQESLLHLMQQENKNLQQRIRQYEHCLDDVMRKVVDAIVAEDSLREEVSILKSRVRDLEAQNAAICIKGRDEGYCTMSTGQPQPSNSHLEDLPEEPEQWLLSGEPCSADMEDWSLSQEELGVIPLDDDPNDKEIEWIWKTSGYLNSTMIDSQSEGISQLLKETIVYSEDEEIACIDFTKDFYKLVNIPSGSTKSLHSHIDVESDDDGDGDNEDEDEDDDDDKASSNDEGRHCRDGAGQISPTPSEAGQAQVTSCSSSDTCSEKTITPLFCDQSSDASIENTNNHKLNAAVFKTETVNETASSTADKCQSWRRSNGWKLLTPQIKKQSFSDSLKQQHQHHQHLPIKPSQSKIPPPVPVRRSYAS